MKRRKFSEYGYYRHPNTTQELRMSFAHGREFVRAKRYGHNIPNSYDDIAVDIDRKCWKNKRETQYRVGKRGQKHEIFLDYLVYEHYIKEYLEDQDIPYRMSDVRETRTYIRYDGEECKWSVTVGHNLTYWTDKEIRLPKEAFSFRRIYYSWLLED